MTDDLYRAMLDDGIVREGTPPADTTSEALDAPRYRLVGYSCGMEPAHNGGWVCAGAYDELRAEASDAHAACMHMGDMLAARDAELAGLYMAEAELQGYREWGADVRRLTRQLDVELHGEKGAAKQASLCDLIGSGSAIRLRAERAEAAVARLTEALAAAEADAEKLAGLMPTAIAYLEKYEPVGFRVEKDMREALAAHRARLSEREGR